MGNSSSDYLRDPSLAPAPPTNIKDRTEILFDAPTAPSSNSDEDDDNSGPKYLYYRSDKVLGQLYRAINEKKIWYENIKVPVNRDVSVLDGLFTHIVSECASRLEGIGWTRAIIKRAWEIRHA